jgi:hypothetical protein
MAVRRYGWWGDPLLHLILIAVLVACLGFWQSSRGPAVHEMGAEARVIWPPSATLPLDPPGGPPAPAPPRAL